MRLEQDLEKPEIALFIAVKGEVKEGSQWKT
jgi:hypothetical protein